MPCTRNRMLAACAIAAVGLAAAPAAATTLDVYFTRDADVARNRPDPGPGHNGWFQADTSGAQQNQVLADANSTFWVAFLNDGPRDDPKTMFIEVSTDDPDATGPRHDEGDTGGYRGDDNTTPVPFDWVQYTYGARDEGGTAVKYWSGQLHFDDCPRWEVFQLENVNDFPVFFTVRNSKCGCEERRKTVMLMDDMSFGTPDGVTAESEIIEITLFPLLTEIDEDRTPAFSPPGWAHEFVFFAPDGEPRPQGGVRFYTDQPGLEVGDVHAMEMGTRSFSYGVCEEHAYDAASGALDLYLHDSAQPPWYDGFDLFISQPGNSILHHRGWEGWYGDPAREAYVAPGPALSLPFAADVSGPAHVVRELRAEENVGVYSFTAWHSVPADYASGGGGEFGHSGLGLLNRYAEDEPHDWSMALNFDSNDGMLKVYYGNGLNTVDRPYRPDRWVEVETRIDFEQDWTQVWYDGELLAAYPWTAGIYGDGGGALDLGAVSLFAGDSSAVFHDDLRLERCAPWTEDFGAYASGSSLHGRMGWKGWDDAVPFTAFVTSAPARSDPNAVDVHLEADLVREHCTSDRGVWKYSAWQYIPGDFVSGSTGAPPGTYFNLLNTYEDGGPYHWSVTMQFDSNDGMLKVYYGNGMNTVNVPYVPDEWIEIMVKADFEGDWTEVHYNDELVVGYPWTGGATGGGGGVLDIAAVDLYANGSSPVYYDDLQLRPPCPADLDDSDAVDFGDILSILTAWGGGGPEDLDGSGIVDFGDILVVLTEWGACP